MKHNPRDKRFAIDRDIRDRIVRGVYPPGSRLPVRVELEREFRVSSNTMQHALDLLIQDGYVIPCGREGTFVSERPPCFSRIALIFPEPEEEAVGQNQFYRAFRNELNHVSERMNLSFQLIDGVALLGNFNKINALFSDIRERRLAGMIFLAVPRCFADTPLVDAPDVARVAISNSFVFNIPAVWVDYLGFYRKAIAHLAQEGCRRPAFLVDPYSLETFLEFAAEELPRHGLPFCRRLIQEVHLTSSRGLENLVELLFAPDNPERPDSLVVGDDNRLSLITARLKELGFYGPNSIKIVSLANFPWPTTSHLPVFRIGFDVSQILQLCAELLIRQAKGEAVQEITMLPALYEHEIQL